MLSTGTQKNPFENLPVAQVAELLRTDLETGLAQAESRARLVMFGSNIIEKERRLNSLHILLNQFASPLILILLLSVLVTAAVGHYRDALFVSAAVLVNTLLGFYQEHKAEKALSDLRTYLKQRARVIRGGQELEIDAALIVPGDVVRLAQGDRVPADSRVFFVNDLQADESVLTGESLPIAKSSEPVPPNAALGDQSSMVFAGTLITQGVGTAIVCRTDLSTELGKIASLVAQSREEETPLQAAIRSFSLRLGFLLAFLTLLVFLTGVVRGYSWVEMFVTSVAIAVSAVPEGLPVALTVILAIGVQRMARRKGVIRKLVAAEALGSTTLILTDKTGTLTQARMELSRIVPASGVSKDKLLKLALLNSSVLLENADAPPAEWRLSGRVLETSLVRSAGERGILVEEVKGGFSILSTLPFNAENKFSACVVRGRNKDLLVLLGAPDILVENSVLKAGDKRQLLSGIGSLAGAGELVIGVATKEVPRDFALPGLQPARLSFAGLITLRDPVRPDVRDAIRRVEAAGIRTVLLTGDHKGTAEAVAREVGLMVGEGDVLDAADLRSLSDAEFLRRLPSLRVIARVSPADKLRVVRAFQDLGEVVAMTGDGVNDAPSIKQANIGIAMGSGTEVARDVADLVLLDDNFETIAAAVEEGRQILNNIRKVLVYILSNVADAFFLIGGALLAGLVLPLNALQILWVNFFTDSFTAVAFAFEKDIDGLIARPLDFRRGLFDPLMKFLILGVGLMTSALLFLLYWYLLRAGYPDELVRTFVFMCFGSYTLFLAFSARSLDRSIFSYSLLSNRYLTAGVGFGFILMLSAVYLPFLGGILGTVPLPPLWLFGVLIVGLLNMSGMEFGKWLFRRSGKDRENLPRTAGYEKIPA